MEKETTDRDNFITQGTVYSTFRVIALVAIILSGLFLRFEHLDAWRQDPSKAVYLKQPLMTTFDGYYYLRYARDLVEGTYDRIDSLRLTPQKTLRPSPPPLLSIVTAVIMKIMSASPGWVAGFLPAMIGIFLVFPVFLIGKAIGGQVTGLFAAFVGVCSPMYVARTGFGRYDTDCGNVTFTMFAVYFSMMIFKNRGPERILYILAYILNFLLFFLWWDTAPQVTITVCIVPLVLAFAFLSKTKKSDLKYLVFAGLFVFFLITAWKGVSYWQSFPKSLTGIIDYVTRVEKGSFPAVGITVSEQSHLSFYDIIDQTSGSFLLFFVSITGTVILFYRNFRIAGLLIMPLLLGGISFFFGRRFSIFLAPILGVGSGYLLQVLINKAQYLESNRYSIAMKRKLKPSTIISVLFVVLLIAPLINANLNRKQYPSEPSFMVEGMEIIREKTPQDSIIWNWWDHGHAMMYWSRRPTISDGASHGGELSLINAFPLATYDFRQAANWMHFYVSRGRAGFRTIYNRVGNVGKGLDLIKEIMAAGPLESLEIIAENQFVPANKWLLFFFPPVSERKDIYLFLDSKLTTTAYWWYWLGSWRPDQKKGVHPVYHVFTDVADKGDIISGHPAFYLEKNTGIFTFEGDNIPISQYIFDEKDGWDAIPYNNKGLVFQFNSDFKGGVLCSGNIFQSIFNRLFFFRMTDPIYFRAVHLNQPSFQVWKVNGDIVSE